MPVVKTNPGGCSKFVDVDGLTRCSYFFCAGSPIRSAGREHLLDSFTRRNLASGHGVFCPLCFPSLNWSSCGIRTSARLSQSRSGAPWSLPMSGTVQGATECQEREKGQPDARPWPLSAADRLGLPHGLEVTKLADARGCEFAPIAGVLDPAER
jgi:hypothetical protein